MRSLFSTTNPPLGVGGFYLSREHFSEKRSDPSSLEQPSSVWMVLKGDLDGAEGIQLDCNTSFVRQRKALQDHRRRSEEHRLHFGTWRRERFSRSCHRGETDGSTGSLHAQIIPHSPRTAAQEHVHQSMTGAPTIQRSISLFGFPS